MRETRVVPATRSCKKRHARLLKYCPVWLNRYQWVAGWQLLPKLSGDTSHLVQLCRQRGLAYSMLRTGRCLGYKEPSRCDEET